MTGPSTERIEQFEREGYLHVPGAFDRTTAAAGASWLYDQIAAAHPDFDPDDEATYPGPKFLYPGSAAPPFVTAATSSVVAAACDALVGVGRWTPRFGLGAFPIRFPHPDDANDDGWHIDASIPHPEGAWWVNVASRNRALLSLWLFTDVTAADAPTRIRVGSHLSVAAYLSEFGDKGVPWPLPLDELRLDDLPVVEATGEAGDVFLCHPFLVHAAGSHPARPRIIAQPDIAHDAGVGTWRADGDYSPVERAIRAGIDAAGLPIPEIEPQPHVA